MKKQFTYLIIVIIALCSQMAFAQESTSENSSKESEWGLKFGASRHWQKEDDFNFDADLGFLGGMYFQKQRGRFIATSYEWQIMQMGYRVDDPVSSNLDKIIVNRTYIQTLLNLHITPAAFVDISIGAYAGIVAASNEKWHFATEVDERDEEGNLRQFDAGAKLSASFWLNKIGLSLEYYHGFVNTSTRPDSDLVFTNRAIALSAKFKMQN